MNKSYGMSSVTLLLFFAYLTAGSGKAQASLMHTTITGQINNVWSDPSLGLDIGDTVFAEFVYDDGDIDHAPWVSGSMEPLRRYQSTALVILDPKLVDWMNQQGVYTQGSDVGSYQLYEPDGTELNEMFTIDNNLFLLSIYHSFGAVGDEMYFSLYGQRGGFSAYGLSLVTTPLHEVPEPTTLLLFSSGTALCLYTRRRGRKDIKTERTQIPATAAGCV